MPIELNLEQLKKQYKPIKKESAIAPEKVKEFIEKLYGEKEPVYPDPDDIEGYEFGETQKQVNLMCGYLQGIGMPKAGALSSKFRYRAFDKDSAQRLQKIKETMEYMVYALSHSNTPAEELGAKFADRALECDDGTLTNLQAIVGELTLEGQGINSYITEQKDAMITAFIQEMYHEGRFTDFPLHRRMNAYEIHNISSLKNLIADDFGVQKKSREEDHYLYDLQWPFSNAKSQIVKQIKKKFEQQEVINSFTGGITSKIVENLPTFVENKYPGQPTRFGQDVDESLEALKLAGIVSQTALLKMENFSILGYKDNIESIIQDAVTIHLHEKGVINHPEIEVVKMRIALESSVDPIVGKNLVQFEDLETQKEAGLLEKSLEYMIKNGLQFEDAEDHFSNPSLATQDPLKYAINNNIKLNGMHPVEYAISNDLQIDGQDPLKYAIEKELDFDGTTPKQAALEHVIEKYLDTSDVATRERLEKRYKKIHQMGSEGEVELLSVDSHLGKFISEAKNMSLMSEVGRDSGVIEVLSNKELATKCDLELIEKCTKFIEKESQMKPRNYDKLSTAQKAGVAVSIIIPPLAGAVYYLMKKSNKQKKERLQEELSVKIDGVFKDLDKIFKSTSKEKAPAIKAKDQPQTLKQQAATIAAGINHHKIAKGKPKPTPYTRTSSKSR